MQPPVVPVPPAVASPFRRRQHPVAVLTAVPVVAVGLSRQSPPVVVLPTPSALPLLAVAVESIVSAQQLLPGAVVPIAPVHLSLRVAAAPIYCSRVKILGFSLARPVDFHYTTRHKPSQWANDGSFSPDTETNSCTQSVIPFALENSGALLCENTETQCF